ncbi:hypothetical protein DXG01_007636 [Tephrocybe rancida]|nr:hypothetical protein DXG01_007636 [Tephrocybe rancida]
MSSTPAVPAAPKPKLADLPPTDLEEGEHFEEGPTSGADLPVEDGFEHISATFDDGSSNVLGTDVNEMYERNLQLLNDSIEDRPLVDDIIPISQLRDEYKKAKFIEQITWLEEHGFHSIRRTKASNEHQPAPSPRNTAFAFAFIDRLFRAPHINDAVGDALLALETTLPMLEAVGFDKISYEDSYTYFRDLIGSIVGIQNGVQVLTEADLLASFQDLYIVYYLRLVTVSVALYTHNAAQIQLAADDFAPFLTNQDIPNSEDMMDPQDFCAKFVIPLGKEADDVQISALCRILEMNVDIAYVDGREDHRATSNKVHFVPFRSDVKKNAEPIALLYRTIQRQNSVDSPKGQVIMTFWLANITNDRLRTTF